MGSEWVMASQLRWTSKSVDLLPDNVISDCGTRFIDGYLLGREEKDFESGGDEGTLCYCGVSIGH